MVRFSCTPTSDMGINDLKIALQAVKTAQEHDIELVVRIDDLDTANNIEKKDQEILDLLDLFGIKYSQVLYESKNSKFHAAMALQLLHEKKAFNCFCSDEWLEKKQQEAYEQNKPYRYDDACKNLPPELVIDNTAPFRVRILGTKAIESFEILHQDKSATSLFASAIDDMLSDISIVVCTPQQQLQSEKEHYIREQLGYNKEISYQSVIPFKENISLKQLLQKGYLPEAISNYLVSLRNSDIFDMEALKKSNQKYLQNLDPKELSRYVGFADAEIGALAKLFLDDATTTQALKKKVESVFAPRIIPDELQDDYAKLKNTLKEMEYFENYSDFYQAVAQQTGFEDKKLSTLLTLLLVNSTQTFPLEKAYNYLKNYIEELIKK